MQRVGNAHISCIMVVSWQDMPGYMSKTTWQTRPVTSFGRLSQQSVRAVCTASVQGGKVCRTPTAQLQPAKPCSLSCELLETICMHSLLGTFPRRLSIESMVRKLFSALSDGLENPDLHAHAFKPDFQSTIFRLPLLSSRCWELHSASVGRDCL